MSVFQTYNSKEVQIVCSPDTTMSEMALASQMGFGWFLGHGVYRFRIRRLWEDGNLHLRWSTDLQPKLLEFAPGAAFRDLASEGYLLRKFPVSEIWTPPTDRPAEFKITLGLQRVSSHGDYTLIEGRAVPPSQQIFAEAYSMSDMLVTTFVAGVKEMQYQVSLDMIQVRLDRSFSEKVVRGWFDRRSFEPTYQPSDKVTRIK